MDFDADKFIYISAWVVAVVATVLTLLGAAGAYYYNFTLAGRMEVLSMRLRTGMVPGFRWSLPVVATLAWIAVLSFS